MDSRLAEIIHDFPPFFRIHASGHVDRYMEHDFLPPSSDPQNGVVSKDAVISLENNLSVRLYLPKTTQPAAKFPLVVYIHGGAFSIQSAFSSMYHPYTNSLAAASQSVVVSIEYRLAPEHPIPAGYDDSYEAVKWVLSHSRAGHGPDPWLNEYADFERVFITGDSAGANIAHDIIIRSTESEWSMFTGLILIHPLFFEGHSSKLWDYICPENGGSYEFRLDPTTDLGRLSKLGCERVLICVAEKDLIRDRGWKYYQGLKNSGWRGVVEFFETAREKHVFHLLDPSAENAISLMNRVVGFIKGGGARLASQL